jgi:hypothetical protein
VLPVKILELTLGPLLDEGVAESASPESAAARNCDAKTCEPRPRERVWPEPGEEAAADKRATPRGTTVVEEGFDIDAECCLCNWWIRGEEVGTSVDSEGAEGVRRRGEVTAQEPRLVVFGGDGGLRAIGGSRAGEEDATWDWCCDGRGGTGGGGESCGIIPNGVGLRLPEARTMSSGSEVREMLRLCGERLLPELGMRFLSAPSIPSRSSVTEVSEEAISSFDFGLRAEVTKGLEVDLPTEPNQEPALEGGPDGRFCGWRERGRLDFGFVPEMGGVEEFE